MPVLLSHNTALERLRSVPPQVDTAVICKEPLPFAPFAHAGASLSREVLEPLGIKQRPAHRLIPSNSHQKASSLSKPHRCGLDSLPAGLVRKVTSEVYVCGPELCFIQMATLVSPIGAVVLGYELCGSYSHFAQLVSGFYERPALTSVRKIGEAIENLAGLYNLRPAREALRWVRDGSASPMEAVVSCMLHLPTDMGGFGLVAPELNLEVPLDEVSRRITGTESCKIDTAYAAAKTGAEYDGEEYHRDMEKDRKRREALAHEGWTIYVLNVDELTKYDRLKEKADLMDRVARLGGEPDARLGKTLIRRLLTATRCGLGLNAALFGVPVSRGMIKVHV